MVQSINKKFTGAVDLSRDPTTVGWLTHVLVSFDSRPSTSENLTITLVNEDDDDLNIVLEIIDPSVTTELLPIIYAPRPIPLSFKESVQVEYANTDGNTVGVIIKGTDGKFE